jgi:hypothetical protein
MIDTKISLYGNCPVCAENWDGGSIVDTFLEQKKNGHWSNYTEDQIKNYVKEFYSEPYRWSQLIYINKLDGEDVHMCPSCECEFPLDKIYK